MSEFAKTVVAALSQPEGGLKENLGKAIQTVGNAQKAKQFQQIIKKQKLLQMVQMVKQQQQQQQQLQQVAQQQFGQPQNVA